VANRRDGDDERRTFAFVLILVGLIVLIGVGINTTPGHRAIEKLLGVKLRAEEAEHR
jgi:hypothetical protein